VDATTKRHLVEGGAIVAVGIIVVLLLRSGPGGGMETIDGSTPVTIPGGAINSSTPNGVTLPAATLGNPGPITIGGNYNPFAAGNSSNEGPVIQTFNTPQMPVIPGDGGGSCCCDGCDTDAGDMNVFSSPANLQSYLSGVLNNGSYAGTFLPSVADYMAGGAYNSTGLTSASL
jgi:hypothetical protein